MSDPQNAHSLEQPCPGCGALMDLTGFLPFEEIVCPSCGHEWRVRDRFDHYKIEGLRGLGGMSQVFTARDMHLQRQVALKVLNRENSSKQDRIDQFEREARLTASITHPNVVRVYGVGRVAGNFYIAMEMVDGPSLEDLLKSEHKLAEARVLDLAVQTVEGLAAAFRIGLIHRDIKPGNILMTPEGKAKLVDFGLALVFETDTDESEEIWATPYYVAPEKLDGRPEDFRSDIYSLGATLFHLLAGRPAHDSSSPSIDELKHLKANPVKLGLYAPMVSLPTQDVIHKMMEHDPEQRHTSYEQLLTELNAARDNLRASLDNVRGVTRQARREAEKRRSLRRLAATAVAVVCVLAALVMLQMMSANNGAEDPGQQAADPAEDGMWQAGSLETGNISERFLDARRELVGGKYDEARADFEELAGDANVRQPTLNWSAFQAALACLLQGEPGDARRIVERARANPRFREGRTGELGPYFATLADQFLSPWPVDESAVSGLREKFPDHWQFGAVLLALKNWEHGRFASAAAILDKVKKNRASADLAWLADMDSVWTAMILDAENIGSLPDARSLKTMADYEAALAELNLVAGQLRREGRGRRAVESRLARWTAERDRLADAESNQQAEETARRREVESQDLAALLVRLDGLREGYRYEEGVIEIEAFSPTLEDIESRRKSLLWYWQGGVDFIGHLITDINTHGYKGAFQPTAGGLVAPSVSITRATRSTLIIESRAGALPADLSRVPARQLAAIASAMLEKTVDERARRERRESLVLFASHHRLDDIVSLQSTALSGQQGADVFSIRWRALSAIPGAIPGDEEAPAESAREEVSSQ